jgi:hypothetical protein
VVRSTTLVAGGRASTASETAPEATSVAATGSASTATAHAWVGAVAGKVAGKTAAVATSARASSAQAQRRAVSLDVAESLAVVALLGCPLVSPVLGSSVYAALGVLEVSPARFADEPSDSGESVQAWDDVLSVVRGCGHPLDSCPGCLPRKGLVWVCAAIASWVLQL